MLSVVLSAVRLWGRTLSEAEGGWKVKGGREPGVPGSLLKLAMEARHTCDLDHASLCSGYVKGYLLLEPTGGMILYP
jgi:hypothetical protein